MKTQYVLTIVPHSYNKMYDFRGITERGILLFVMSVFFAARAGLLAVIKGAPKRTQMLDKKIKFLLFFGFSSQNNDPADY